MSSPPSSRDFDGDAGAPLPDFSGARNISLTTVGPALGVTQQAPPDYLEYDQKGRGLVVTMFANTGVAYLMGILGGGLMGLQRGLQSTPSTKWRVQVNSVLNATGRYGSKAGNTLGVLAVMYSLYEGLGDQLELDDYIPSTGSSSSPVIDALSVAPPLAAMMTGGTFFAPSGPRVAALGGAIGLGAVGTTYAAYAVMGKPYGSYGFLWF